MVDFFIVNKGSSGALELLFTESNNEEMVDLNHMPLCNVPLHVFMVGDLKIYAQMLG